MASLLFKALLFYGLFLFLRWAWRFYRLFSLFRREIKKSQQQSRDPKSPPGGKGKGDVIEAEFRVLNDGD